MAEREIRRLLKIISARHPCLAATVIHRVGIIPVGETAIYVGVAGRHRGEALALLAEFMDRLKLDVPIWKRRAVQMPKSEVRSQKSESATGQQQSALALDAAIAAISSRCQPLSPGSAADS